MCISVQRIHITINPKITLSPPLKPFCLEGNYIALPKRDKEQGIYELYEADDQWQPKQPYIATVGIKIGSDGKAYIS